MSHWNHRVVIKDKYFGIHEVYYDDTDTPEMVTENPMAPFGETLKELRWEISRFARALKHPVLRYEDIGKSKLSIDEAANVIYPPCDCIGGLTLHFGVDRDRMVAECNKCNATWSSPATDGVGLSDLLDEKTLEMISKRAL